MWSSHTPRLNRVKYIKSNIVLQPEKKQDYDLAMVGRYGVLGSTVFPTFLYYWYKLLDGKVLKQQ